ncbi:MAG: hypothetical protein HY537_10145 [Deltaproteobacteria bacterium]|nr:hypothetical protein [Deltaproteobacteria bacterium]
MQVRLPILNCLWNDVLHFSTIHPHLIWNALQESCTIAGAVAKDVILPERLWYKIPVTKLMTMPAIYFHNRLNNHDERYIFSGNEFEKLD